MTAHKCLSSNPRACLATITAGNNSSWRSCIISLFLQVNVLNENFVEGDGLPEEASYLSSYFLEL